MPGPLLTSGIDPSTSQVGVRHPSPTVSGHEDSYAVSCISDNTVVHLKAVGWDGGGGGLNQSYTQSG